jgi:hypothetical protein
MGDIVDPDFRSPVELRYDALRLWLTRIVDNNQFKVRPRLIL